DEVFALATSVTVLRRGQGVFAGPLAGLNSSTLAEKMIGGASAGIQPEKRKSDGASAVLELKNIRLPRTLSIDSLQVHAAEIVGIAGVEGNGQTELAAAIAGTLPVPFGSVIRLEDRSLAELSIRERSDAGIGYIPADRHHEGLILDFSLSENLHARKQLIRKI